jgi:hypothetical protein
MISGLLAMAILCTSFISWMLISGAFINAFIKDTDNALIAFALSALTWAAIAYNLIERFVK